MRRLRIEIGAKHSYLVWDNGIDAPVYQGIHPSSFTNMPLVRAYRGMRSNVKAIRDMAKDATNAKWESLYHRLKFYQAHKQARKRHMALEAKTPKTNHKYVGIEIEFISSYDKTAILNALVEAELERHVSLTTDGSVSDDSEVDCDGSCRDNCECMYCDDLHETEDEDGRIGTRYCEGSDDHPDWECNCECTCSGGGTGRELRVLTTRQDLVKVVTKVCKVLADCGAKVNDTCGLHVHLDMRRGVALKSYANLVIMQDLLYSMVPASRRANTYCAPNASCELTDQEANGRYHGVNKQAFSEHRTLEVRIHSGTVNATKIINWCKLLIAIADSKAVLVKPTDLGHAVSQLNLDFELATYCALRINKFRRRHGKTYLVDLPKVDVDTDSEAA